MALTLTEKRSQKLLREFLYYGDKHEILPQHSIHLACLSIVTIMLPATHIPTKDHIFALERHFSVKGRSYDSLDITVLCDDLIEYMRQELREFNRI